MQTAAEAAREESVSRLQADAKAAIEDIHGRSATEAADLRRRADDDVSSIREWSKQEIARIREETETKVADRKSHLEREIEEHAALIERHIDRVQGRVTSFETEMASFFERLLAEDDPTRFAEMAESLPEPPPFDEVEFGLSTPVNASAAETAAAATTEVTDAPELAESDAATSGVAETAVEPAEGDTEAAMAAIQAAAEAAATESHGDSTDAEATDAPATDADAPPAEAPAVEAETQGETERQADNPTDRVVQPTDPRLAAFGFSADFAAAEAEAAAAVETADETEDIPVIADEALAARLAGLVPAEGNADAPTSDTKVTQVVVTGLVSVASIASFKRHLGRMAGVASVGVTSGPEGEFVFAVTHGLDLVLRDAVPAMPGFQARVTGGDENTVEVSARDPETEG
jgi:hypothetical protein